MSIAFTSGEPSGIGPDIAILHAQEERTKDLQVFCDPDVLISRAKILKLPLSLTDKPTKNAGELFIFPIKAKTKVLPGKLNPDNAEYVLSLLQQATKSCIDNQSSGILTGPVNKAVINDAGIKFSGHTEYFAELSDTPKTVMLLATSKLKVALATTHLALNEVPKNINKDSLIEVITIINNNFKFLGVNKPKILVCGLNPHAGEGGLIGEEEKKIILPVVEDLKAKNLNLHGPLSGDTCFFKHNRKNYDGMFCMFHDQGLSPVKTLDFFNSVNVTGGLPILRVSPDHGPAFDIAKKNIAKTDSLIACLKFIEKYS